MYLACSTHVDGLWLLSALYCDDEGGGMRGDTLLYTYSSTWIACVPAFPDLGANRMKGLFLLSLLSLLPSPGIRCTRRTESLSFPHSLPSSQLRTTSTCTETKVRGRMHSLSTLPAFNSTVGASQYMELQGVSGLKPLRSHSNAHT